MLYTPKKTVETVVDTHNDLVVQLKRNQPSLHDAMVEYATTQAPTDTDRTDDIGKRNRIETRESSVWPLPKGSGTKLWHDHFKTLIRIDRHVDRFDTQKKDWQTSEETAYYLCTRPIDATQANQVVRSHWGIENRTHYVRDTRMNEDASRIRKNPSIFVLLRSFTLNLMRFNKIGNISLALYDNALSLDRVLGYRGF